jgi:hypothetical protein
VSGFEPGEPDRKMTHYKAEIAAGRLTAGEAADRMYAWARSAGWRVTRASIERDLGPDPRRPPPMPKDPR